MGKPKKISITFYLNKQLKDRQLNGVSHFPVYARVLFNQMSNRLPFVCQYKLGFLTDQEFHSFIKRRTDPAIRQELETFEQTIEKIIRFEYGIQGDEFKLVGLKDKLFTYQHTLLRGLEIALNRHLLKYCHVNDLDPGCITFSELYLILEANDPQIRKRITGQLEAQIEAFLSLLTFLHTQEGAAPYLLDWLDPGFHSKYKESLFNSDPEQNLVFQRDPVFRKLKIAFPAKISRIPMYLSILDRLVLEAA